MNSTTSIQTYHTPSSIISENCLWIVDGYRHICVTYVYSPHTGNINYAASILKLGPEEFPNDQQINGHEQTTTRRFDIRRANANIGTHLIYDDMLKKIRREMCHGQGCVGPRQKLNRCDDDEQSLSSVECMSDGGDSAISIIEPKIEELVSKMAPFKQVKTVKYSCIVKEPHGDYQFTIRTYYIAFKGDKNTGDAMYGCCLSHEGCYSKGEYIEPQLDDDGHYETAIMRLEKCPVYIKIHDDYKPQLSITAPHCEDVMYNILDKINTRVDGFMQIKGARLSGYFC